MHLPPHLLSSRKPHNNVDCIQTCWLNQDLPHILCSFYDMKQDSNRTTRYLLLASNTHNLQNWDNPFLAFAVVSAVEAQLVSTLELVPVREASGSHLRLSCDVSVSSNFFG
mmetsp:Transcript_16144/g.39773  ORF Transcript_16144/g.39773 Transcript_16144/m.39773 type:complete len:111 (+) Transcript_16144:1287-1619(+)